MFTYMYTYIERERERERCFGKFEDKKFCWKLKKIKKVKLLPKLTHERGV